MTREELEEAIRVLDRLLEAGENRESVFQDYFEQYKLVFEVLGYAEAFPLRHLPLAEEIREKTGVDHLEPDFILRRHSGLFDILDLKTPLEKLLRDIPHRESFYARINEYISQVVNYSEYFDDGANREWVRDRLHLDIHKDPDVVLIVGRDAGVDKPSLHKELRERTNRLTILTFDDVITNLRFHYARLFGRTDNLPGFSLYLVMNVQKGRKNKRRYVYDCGSSAAHDRFSVYLDNERVHFEVLDGSSTSYHLSAKVPAEFFRTGEPFHLSCLFGNGADLCILQLRINNSIVAEAVLTEGLSVAPTLDAEQFTMGQDLEGRNAEGPTFGLFALVVCGQIHSFDERMKAFEDLYFYPFKQCCHFHEGACMYSSKMPEPPGNILRRQSQDLRPRVRSYPFKE